MLYFTHFAILVYPGLVEVKGKIVREEELAS